MLRGDEKSKRSVDKPLYNRSVNFDTSLMEAKPNRTMNQNKNRPNSSHWILFCHKKEIGKTFKFGKRVSCDFSFTNYDRIWTDLILYKSKDICACDLYNNVFCIKKLISVYFILQQLDMFLRFVTNIVSILLPCKCDFLN